MNVPLSAAEPATNPAGQAKCFGQQEETVSRPFAFFIRVLNPEKDGFNESQQLSEGVLKYVCKEFDMDLLDASDFNSTGRISEQVLLGIKEADVVFADANTVNENIWYEIGYTHCVNPKKLIYLFQKGKALPFDIADFRGLPYSNDPISIRQLDASLEAMVKNVISHTALDRLLRSDYWHSAVAEYVGTRPALQNEFFASLKSTATNIDFSPEMRRRALKVLLRLGYVDIELCTGLSGPLVEENIRSTVFDALALTESKIPNTIWENGLADSPRDSVLSAVSTAAATKWLKGDIDDEFFRNRFVKHQKWIARKYVTLYLVEHLEEKSIEHLKVLATDSRTEIYGRIHEWIDRKMLKPEDITELDRVFASELLDIWRTSDKPSIKNRIAALKVLSAV